MTTKKKTSAVAQKTPVNSAVPTRVLRTGAKPAGFYNETTLFRAAIQAPLRSHAGGKKDTALAQPRRIYRLQKPQRTTENHSAPARTGPFRWSPSERTPFARKWKPGSMDPRRLTSRKTRLRDSERSLRLMGTDCADTVLVCTLRGFVSWRSCSGSRGGSSEARRGTWRDA